MVDIHSHILPNVDDGSASPEESAQLLRLSRQQGVTLQVATPHFYATKATPDRFLARRQAAWEALPYDAQSMPRLLLGAEVAYFSSMCNCEALIQMQLGDSGLLLVEMPFSRWTDRMIQDVLQLQQLGLRPVLAHVERYDGMGQLSAYRDLLLGEGVLLQCNAAAFLPAFSRYTRMLQKGEIHFLGSDCHNMTTRPPKLDKAAQRIGVKLGGHALEELDRFAYNMLRIE